MRQVVQHVFVRVLLPVAPGIFNQIKERVDVVSTDGLNPEQQLDKIIDTTKFLLKKSNDVWANLKVNLNKELNDAIYHIERNGNPKIILLDLSMKLTRFLHKKEETV